MDLGLRGRTALITGASRVIGKAISLELAREGVRVRLTARSAAGLEAVRNEIKATSGDDAKIFPLDLSDSKSVDVLARLCDNVDILINNAGAIPRGRLDGIDEERWVKAWGLNVFGYINMTREFYAIMKARGKGTIINILGNGGERLDAGYICGSTGNAALMAFKRPLGRGGPHPR